MSITGPDIFSRYNLPNSRGISDNVISINEIRRGGENLASELLNSTPAEQDRFISRITEPLSKITIMKKVLSKLVGDHTSETTIKVDRLNLRISNSVAEDYLKLNPIQRADMLRALGSDSVVLLLMGLRSLYVNKPAQRNSIYNEIIRLTTLRLRELELRFSTINDQNTRKALAILTYIKENISTGAMAIYNPETDAHLNLLLSNVQPPDPQSFTEEGIIGTGRMWGCVCHAKLFQALARQIGLNSRYISALDTNWIAEFKTDPANHQQPRGHAVNILPNGIIVDATRAWGVPDPANLHSLNVLEQNFIFTRAQNDHYEMEFGNNRVRFWIYYVGESAPYNSEHGEHGSIRTEQEYAKKYSAE